MNKTMQSTEAPSSSSSSSSSSSPSIFPLLPTITQCRQMYGLRNDDYKRYRQFCSHRVARLRKSCGFQQKKGKLYLKKPVNLNGITQLKQLWIPVFTIERYWSFAMDLDSQARILEEPESNQKRRHQLKKLRLLYKAACALDTLVDQLKESKSSSIPLSSIDLMDVHAYTSFMRGYSLFVYRKWQKALSELTRAKSLYETLAQVDTEHQPSRETFVPGVLQLLDPYIRYCTYYLSKEGHSVEALVQLIASNEEKTHLELALDQLVIQDTIQPRLTSLNFDFLNDSIMIKQSSLIHLLTQLQSLIQSLPLLSSVKEKQTAYQGMMSLMYPLEQKALKWQYPLLINFTHYMKHMIAIHRTCSFLKPIHPTLPISIHHTSMNLEQVHFVDTLLQHLDQLSSSSSSTSSSSVSSSLLLMSPSFQSTLSYTRTYFQARKAWVSGFYKAKQQRWVESELDFKEAKDLLFKYSTPQSLASILWFQELGSFALPFPECKELTFSMCEGRLVWLRAQSHLHSVPSSSSSSSSSFAPSLLHAPYAFTCSHFFSPLAPLPIPAKPMVLDLAYEWIRFPSLFTQLNGLISTHNNKDKTKTTKKKKQGGTKSIKKKTKLPSNFISSLSTVRSKNNRMSKSKPTVLRTKDKVGTSLPESITTTTKTTSSTTTTTSSSSGLFGWLSSFRGKSSSE